MIGQLEEEEQIRERRRQRVERMQREKELQQKRRQSFRKLFPVVIGGLLFCVFVGAFWGIRHQLPTKDKTAGELSGAEGAEDIQGGRIEAQGNLEEDTEALTNAVDSIGGEALSDTDNGDKVTEVSEKEKPQIYTAELTDKTKELGEEIVSSHAILVDLEKGEILARKDAMTRMNPASMTKILTVLVAAEQLEERNLALSDKFTMTLEITDYGYVHDCSSVGFLADEVITVEDLFYGTILKSGADAAVGLATYVAGSQEAFVELMNERLKELGLSQTAHFTNCVGIYDEEHYCTLYDMAMILEAAMDNELCRRVLSEHTYTTSKTSEHPEGITISNWFLRRIEDKDTGGEVLYGKTGYVKESGNCAASYAESPDGKGYICVTAGAGHYWKCIYDHVDIYKQFLG